MTRRASKRSLSQKPSQSSPQAAENPIYNEFAPVESANVIVNKAVNEEISGSDRESSSETGSESETSALQNLNKSALTMGESADTKAHKNQPKKEIMKRLAIKEEFTTFRMSFFLSPIAAIAMIVLGKLFISTL